MNIDSGVKDTFIVHLENNQETKLTSCGHGIYYFDTANASPVETPQDKITDNEKLINIKSLLPATHFSPLLPPIKNILPDAKLKEQIMQDYCRLG